MKTTNLIFSLWTGSLVLSFVFGIAFAVYQIVTGNIPPIYI
jgi:hypothetical protein